MNKEDAINRIKAMADRPEMWAYSYESFLMQLGLLLEVGGLDRVTVHRWITKHGSDLINLFSEQVTQKGAKPLCMSALQQLENTGN